MARLRVQIKRVDSSLPLPQHETPGAVGFDLLCRKEVTVPPGPVAVLPLYQRQGIGEKLIEHGIQKLKEKGCPYVVVLGHPEYYGRFGFETSSNHGIRCEWEGPEVPDDAFMVLVLDKSTMQGVKGLAKYRPEFSSAL